MIEPDAPDTALLARPPVRRVQEALATRGSAGRVVVLAATARTAADAAAALGCPLGAIVKSLVFMAGDRALLGLVAGDRRCETGVLAASLGMTGKVRRADADEAREATGFTIGGVAPLGHRSKAGKEVDLPIAIDASLGRFATIYAAAGHPHCVFATSLEELAALTGAPVVEGLSG